MLRRNGLEKFYFTFGSTEASSYWKSRVSSVKFRKNLGSRNGEIISDVTNDSSPIQEWRLLLAKYKDIIYTTVQTVDRCLCKIILTVIASILNIWCLCLKFENYWKALQSATHLK